MPRYRQEIWLRWIISGNKQHRACAELNQRGGKPRNERRPETGLPRNIVQTVNWKMVEGPGCTLNGEKIRSRVQRGQKVKEHRGTLVKPSSVRLVVVLVS